jgi:putative transposase
MADYRRWYIPGGTAFFTVVTYRRRSIFTDTTACRLLGRAMRKVREELPFNTVAAAVLPDHLHIIWTLPIGDDDYSTRWKRIKREFTVSWLETGGRPARVTESQQERGHRGVWQRRFYEHQVRDEAELAALCDYIHYNPVKHGYASAPRDWRHSTFRRFVEAGQYSMDWGACAAPACAMLDLD